MGKTYLFECEKCGYRAKVTGGFSEGNELRVQTIHCRDCRELHDCIIALRKDATPALWKRLDQAQENLQPKLAAALNRLPDSSTDSTTWVTFDPLCPVDPTHRIEPWKAPGRCPRCKAYLERGALPYRVWD